MSVNNKMLAIRSDSIHNIPIIIYNFHNNDVLINKLTTHVIDFLTGYPNKCITTKVESHINENNILFGGELSKLCNKSSILCGICINSDVTHLENFNKCLYLRGPLSRQTIKSIYPNRYISQFYGSHLTMLPLIHYPKSKTNSNSKFLIIVNNDDSVKYHQLKLRNADLMTIDLLYNYTFFIDEMNKYEYIITSSVYFTMIAYAYGKKILNVKKIISELDESFQIMDFLKSVGSKVCITTIDDCIVNKSININENKLTVPNVNKLYSMWYNVVNLSPFINNSRTIELNNIIYNKINLSDYFICIETYVLDNEYNKNIINKRLKYFMKYTYQSIINQLNKCYFWFIYIKQDNEYLINKIKELDIVTHSNVKIYYYDVNESIREVKNKITEGTVRGNYTRRGEITKINMEKYKEELKGKILIKMCIDDDDYIENTHFNDVIFYAKLHNNNEKDLIVGVRNLKINYVPDSKIMNITSQYIVHGNKFYIANNNINYCGYSIQERLLENDVIEIYNGKNIDIKIIEKPNSTFHYMRHDKNHRSCYSKKWIIDEIIDV